MFIMRLDKFLCETTALSRSEAKKAIKNGEIKVNDYVVNKAELNINEKADSIIFNGRSLRYEKFVYFMLYKPKDCVSATNDNVSKTVIDVLNEKDYKDLFPVGRLDKDTTGLLLITNDGDLSHRLLSPKKLVYKTYRATCDKDITKKMCDMLEEGVDIGDETNTAPAKVLSFDKNVIEISITEGRFHEVKRMLHAVGNEVVELERLSMGTLELDKSLKPGEHRRLSDEEVKKLNELVGR